jgi:hypothetical protein
MSWPKLVDLELSDDEKIDSGFPIGPDAKPKQPDYPWGLRISLTEKELEKLDLDINDAEIGDLIDMRAFGVITSISQNDSDGGKCCRVEIQLQKLAIEDEMREDEDD